MIETKTCVECKVLKNKSEYHKNKSSSTGVQSRCKECQSVYKKNRYWSNHTEELEKMTKSRTKKENVEQRKGYYIKNKEKYAARTQLYMADPEKKNNKSEKNRILYQKKKDEIKKHRKEYYKTEVFRAKRREEHKIRKATDIQYNIKRRLRFRLRNCIKGASTGKIKVGSAIELLGCELPTFKQYIEEQFIDGMCWERLSEIHIDHIKPCSKFDLTNEDQQRQCFHYSNLQPLWKEDNLKKNNRYE